MKLSSVDREEESRNRFQVLSVEKDQVISFYFSVVHSNNKRTIFFPSPRTMQLMYLIMVIYMCLVGN